jgi:diguanylate cyclase (GGDEF)-like protein
VLPPPIPTLPTPSPRPAAPSATAAAWARLLALYVGRDTESAEIRARLVQWVTSLTPWLMVVNVVAAVLMATRLPVALPAWLRWTWCGAICVLWMTSFASWLSHRDRAPTRLGPAVVRKSVLHATLLSALWGMLPWALFPTGNAAAQMMIAAVMPSIIAGGGFVLCPLAPAAIAFTLVIGASTSAAIAFHHDPISGALSFVVAAFTAVVIVAILFGARRAVESLRAEREAARQGELVGLLLRDFESASSDVLWETDAQGRLGRVSPKLRALMRLEAGAIGEQTLLGWYEGQCRDEPARRALAQLRRGFADAQAFRQRDVPVRVDGAPRWWAITARPLVDEAGQPQGWRGVITDITLEHDAQARALQMASVDTLTGLANRMQLREHLQAALAGAARRPRALLCLNMDHFKRLNDMFGHGAGDQVLREAAQRLAGLVRASDVVARSGGDEFAVLLDDVAVEADALRFGQRVVEELGRGFASDASAGPGAIAGSVSVGVAMIPGHGQSVDELLANVDLALSSAKAAGRGRCEMFRADMGERQRERMMLERDLRQALARQELRLHWQPQVDTARWRVSGCEALLRWEHAELGLVSPAQFIPLAEETGLIVELGQWVLQQACRIGSRRLPGLMIAVNVSPIQVVRDDFVEVVRQALAAGGLPPQRLELEITESIFIDASPKAMRNLGVLRRMGVRVALDDFGTGYSSLAYLRQFPFDTLKIDRAFVRELVTQHDARAIVRSIVDLATALGMSTVAEGVEEPEQYELLRRAGCGGVQGFLIARPMVIDQVREFLDSWAMQRAPRPDAVPDSIFAPFVADEADDLRGAGDPVH